MLKIRKNVFETNSSSTHSLVISKKDRDYDYDGESRRKNISYHFEEDSTGKVHIEKTFTETPKTESASFRAGDSVFHKVFGKGMVVSAKPMSGDTLLEIAFEKVGTKKLMANFAKLKKE